jgi:putative FmdB family regulatory protein
MPTYEYRCKDCGDELEAVQGFHDNPLTECPTCGGPLRKKFGSVGISFKGSGFYKNDSRPSADSTTSSTSESGSSDAGSSDKTSTSPDKTSPDKGTSPDKASSDKGSSDKSSSDKSSSSGDSGSKAKTPAAT